MAGRLDTEFKLSWAALINRDWSSVSVSALFSPSIKAIRRGQRYAFGNKPLPQPAKDSIAKNTSEQRVPDFINNHQINFAFLEKVILLAKKQGSKVMVMELPRSLQSTKAYTPIWLDYEEGVADLVKANDVMRLDLRDTKFDDTAYYDLEHLLAEYRPELSKVFIEKYIASNR